MPEPVTNKSAWSPRADGSAKGDGFLGVLARPDGKVSTEISIGVGDLIPGKEVEIPTLVPTLSAQEIHFLLTHDPEKADIPRPIVDKAIQFAAQRIQQGLPVFAQPGEQLYHVHPQFRRVDVPAGFNSANIRPVASHTTLASLGRPK